MAPFKKNQDKVPAPAVVLFLVRQRTFLQLRLAEPQRLLARAPLVPGLARPHRAPDQHPGKRADQSMVTLRSQKHIKGVFQQSVKVKRLPTCKRCLSASTQIAHLSTRFVLNPDEV